MLSSMFSFFFKGKEDEGPQTADPVASGSYIPYHANLISQLTSDHKELVAIYQRIEKAWRSGEYSRVSDLLEEFASILRGHLLTENVKLYVYLKRALSKDTENSALMQQLRSEMMHIGKDVVAFLDRYHACDWDEPTRKQFEKELAKIGGVLVKRIKTEEETLYPLYMPPESYG